MASKKVILLARAGHVLQTEDLPAGGAITPGMLVEVNSSKQIVAHATAAGTNVAPLVAMERDEMGKDFDAAYASGDRVKLAHLCSGERFNALVANGYNQAAGVKLESAGNGLLRLLTTGTAVAFALDALNNTSGANARLRVQVI